MAAVGSGITIRILDARIQQVATVRQNANHPNVELSCSSGLVLANHHCVTECPAGYHPVSWSAGENSICLSPIGDPVSLYDLAELQVSADNGATVYLVVPNVPLWKVLITTQNNFSTYVWLPVSYTALAKIETGPSYANWTIPRTTTEVATFGDTVSTFQITEIRSRSVDGVYYFLYPIAGPHEDRTIKTGDDVGIPCLRLSERLVSIDFSNQIAVFTRVQGAPGNCPICLSGNTLIDTPAGQVNVKELSTGMMVWTVNTHGDRISVPITQTGATRVESTHEMVHVILDDGRQLYVSPGHPTTDGRKFGQLRIGESLDGSRVAVAQIVAYDQAYTYDLLPAGDTGFYWANGILVASTMK